MNNGAPSFPLLPSGSKDLQEAVELEISGNTVFLDLTASSIEPKNEKNFQNCLQYLFKCVEVISLQNSSYQIVLNVMYSTVRYRYWNLLIQYLKDNLKLFKKINRLNFTESCFNLKQLLDCHQLFRQCQVEEIQFPMISIHNSHAGIQLTRDCDIRKEKKYRLLYRQMQESVKKSNEDLPDGDLNEPLLDIWREDFFEGIKKDNVADEMFLKHLWLMDCSLSDFLNKGNNSH